MSRAVCGLVFWPFHTHTWSNWSDRKYVPQGVPQWGGELIGVYRECEDCHKRQWARGMK